MLNQELIEVFRKYKSDTEILHDLMQFKVRELLLVATIYDAFSLEQDGLLVEKIFGEYFNLSLSSAPRITSVTSSSQALSMLEERNFQMVVVLSRLSKTETIATGEIIKSKWPDLPVLLLLKDNTDLEAIDNKKELCKYFDNLFVWNGNSEIFLAMIKYVEDVKNVNNDTQLGQVRTILLVEDSVRYYSRYLPHLYLELIRQTSQLVEEEQQEEIKKVLKMRCRPKIILATNYEDAMSKFEHFQEYVLCVITDVKYCRNGILDEQAGIKLAQKLKEIRPDLPILLQSSDGEMKKAAQCIGLAFLHKESQFLSNKLSKFFYRNLGFGDFIFRNGDGSEITRARTMADFRRCLQKVPTESIEYHASKNHFSTWLLARGEIQIAKVVSRIHLTEFDELEHLRDFLINMGDWVYKMKTRGKVISFDEATVGETKHHICKFSDGAIGGKGRGIAFMNYLLYNSNMLEAVPDIVIRIPGTYIIGIEEFSTFLENNVLDEFVTNEYDYEVIKTRFLESKLSDSLRYRLKILLERVKEPLAVRSSGLLEDSVKHSMSGLYETIFVPNNHEDIEVRLQHLTEAIKMVYASVYSPEAREYFDAINYNIEEEKMGIVIQKIAGRKYNNRFYPLISGIAQSYNYYPFSYIQPEDGVSMIVLGLGKNVVDGERSFRFCPGYPHLEMLTPEELVRNSQRKFYALDLTKNTVDLRKGEAATLSKLDIREAEHDGVLSQLVSTWNHLDERLEVGISGKGPRVLNFAEILQYEAYPLAKTIKHILNLGTQALETPVEIEFAVDIDENENGRMIFYLLQMKHMLRDTEECSIDIAGPDKEKMFLFADMGMGNGRIDNIVDILWADPEKFDKSCTEKMAQEVEYFNKKIKQTSNSYILMGPGRWGTRDKWLGIPVTWPQVSKAGVIVEYSLEGFRVDASMGSHFFHNITTMNIGYFSVRQDSGDGFIDWEWLRKQHCLERGEFFVHTRLPKKAAIVMDGRKGSFAVYKKYEDSIVLNLKEVEIDKIKNQAL